MIKYKITGLKQSQLPTGKLEGKKNFNAIMEEPEKVPHWLTTGITSLLPKSGYSKEVRNYQPIMCLTTMYKTLNRNNSQKNSTHLEDQNLLSAEQKGCHPGNKRYKD